VLPGDARRHRSQKCLSSCAHLISGPTAATACDTKSQAIGCLLYPRLNPKGTASLHAGSYPIQLLFVQFAINPRHGPFTFLFPVSAAKISVPFAVARGVLAFVTTTMILRVGGGILRCCLPRCYGAGRSHPLV
jgi:hypothetical protein